MTRSLALPNLAVGVYQRGAGPGARARLSLDDARWRTPGHTGLRTRATGPGRERVEHRRTHHGVRWLRGSRGQYPVKPIKAKPVISTRSLGNRRMSTPLPKPPTRSAPPGPGGGHPS